MSKEPASIQYWPENPESRRDVATELCDNEHAAIIRCSNCAQTIAIIFTNWHSTDEDEMGREYDLWADPAPTGVCADCHESEEDEDE